jgi:pyruvate carboxylase
MSDLKSVSLSADDVVNEILRQRAVGNVDLFRTLQGALNSAKGVTVAGENAKKRKKLFGVFSPDMFDLTDPERMLGFLIGMMLQNRW